MGSIGKLFSKIFSAIFKFLKQIFKAIWPILLIIAIIYFAPAIAGWLTSVGAPGWMSTAFGWIGSTITPTVTSALSWLWSGASSLASSAWTAFKGLDVGTQIAIATGVSAAIAPEETAAVISDVVSTVGSVAAGVLGSAVTALASNPIALLAVVAGVWWLIKRKDNNTTVVLPSEDNDTPEGKAADAALLSPQTQGAS